MCRRIIVVAFLLLSFMCLSVNGQTAIVYSYDSAGNRTSRTTVEATDVASVSSEMIDASGRLNRSLAVFNVPGNITSLAFGYIDEKAGISRTDSSDMAEALGESAGSVASNLEASGGNIIWPFGHNYANQYVSLQPSICIGLETGRCTINIDPYAPMVPNQSTFYVPKL